MHSKIFTEINVVQKAVILKKILTAKQKDVLARDTVVIWGWFQEGSRWEGGEGASIITVFGTSPS